MTIAFLYRWTQKSTGMWYEGSRTANGKEMDIDNFNKWLKRQGGA